MKKIFGAMFALTLGMLGVSQTASATPAGLSGPWAVTLTPANPNNFDLAHIAATTAGLSLGLFENVDYVGRLSTDGVAFNPLQSGLAGASLSGTGLAGKSGTWTFTSGADVYEIVAVEIDATSYVVGTGYLYLTDPAATSGFWDTSDISTWLNGHPTLNYLDFYGVKVSSSDVPEPFSLALIGGGLAGMGFLKRRKRA